MLIENKTQFVADRYGVNDENGKNLLLVLLKATYIFDENGSLSIAEKQEPVEMSDQYYGEPGESSIKYASDFSFDKVATDIALTGHAYAPKGRAKESTIILQVGKIQKTVKVFGDRYWKKTLGFTTMSSPEPFEKIPLIYEKSFGGSDNSNPNPKKHEFERRNSIGLGFRAKKSKVSVEGIKLPNFEDPKNLIKSPDDRPNPAGFGFISPAWQPRFGFVGTYDENWKKNIMPLLPKDFDKKFFNVAHPGLIYTDFLKGNEPVKVSGASPREPVQFSLPGVKPLCSIKNLETEEQPIEMNLDKMVINADENQLILVWSGNVRIPGEFQNIESIKCEIEQ